MVQKKISKGELQHITLYTSRINEEPRHQTLTIHDDQLQIFELFQDISTTVGKEYSFDLLKPTTNVKDFIIELMNTFPDEDYKTIKLLLNDFKDKLKTQQRMLNKYVLLALFKNNLVLIHSRKEPGIGQVDENDKSPLQVIKRYFDSGNVDRWVRVFRVSNDELKIRLYERFKSPILHEFLGISSNERFYEFGDIKLQIKLMDCEFSLDLSVEEAIAKIIDSQYITFKGSHVIIGETRFQLVKILSGKEVIKNPLKLKQILQSEKYNLSKAIEKYQELPSRIDYYGMFLQEDHHSVYSTHVGDGTIENKLLEKPDNPIEIICTNDCVWPTQEYLDYITEKVYQGNALTIFHPGHKLRDIALDFGNIKILNECNLPEDIYQIVKKLFEHANQYDTGSILKHIFLSHAVTILSNSIDEPLKTFLSALGDSICGHCYVDRKEMVTKNENSFIEYKSGRKLTGNIEDDINLIKEDIIKKSSSKSSRLIIYGIDEESMRLDKLHRNILKSDNIGLIEEEIKKCTGMFIKASALSVSDAKQILVISISNPDYVENINMELFNRGLKNG